MIQVRFLSSSYKLKKGESFEKLPVPRLAAARGETLCFQAVLVGDEDDQVQLSGTEGFESEIFWERYVSIPKPSCSYYVAGEYPDVLVDHATAVRFGENTIRANEPKFLFICVKVPRDYEKSTLVFTLRAEGKSTVSAQITAEVFPFVLPEKVHAASSFAIRDDMIRGTQEEKYEKYDEIYKELLKFRLAPTSVALPFSERAKDIPYLIERYKKAAADETVPSYSINYTTFREDTIFQKNQEVLDLKFMKDLMVAMANESTEKLDLFKKAYYYIAFIDEPTPDRFHSVTRVYDEYYKILREVSAECDFSGKENVRASLNALPNIVTVFNKEPIYGQVDTWCPTFFAYCKPEYVYEERHLRRLGKKNWWYGCMAPWHPILNYHTDSPADDARFEPWLRYKYEIGGNLFWAVNLTMRFDDDAQAYVEADILNEPIAFAGVNGDGLLLYTETYYGKILPSYRIMTIFEGNQDYEYFYLLEKYVKALEKECGEKLDLRASLKPIFDEIAAGTILLYRTKAEDLKRELAEHILAAEDGVFVSAETESGRYKITIYCAEDVNLTNIRTEKCGNIRKAVTCLPFENRTTFFTLRYDVNGKEKTFVKRISPAREEIGVSPCVPTRCAVRRIGDDTEILTGKFENGLAPSILIPVEMNAKELLRVEGRVLNLSENEAVIAFSLIDDQGGEYPMGYDMAEKDAESEISVYCTEKAVNRLNNAEDTVWWHHREENERRAAAFDFEKVKGIKLHILNDRKLLDDNVERRLTDYVLILKNLSITKK